MWSRRSGSWRSCTGWPAPARASSCARRTSPRSWPTAIPPPAFPSALAYGDPPPRHYFSTLAIRALAEPRFAHYTPVRMRVVDVSLDFWAPFRLTGIAALANRHQTTYEKYFAFRFPAMNIRAEFEVLK